MNFFIYSVIRFCSFLVSLRKTTIVSIYIFFVIEGIEDWLNLNSRKRKKTKRMIEKLIHTYKVEYDN